MNRKLYYCKSWFRDQKRPTELWTEAQAKEAYEAKQPFTVLVDSVEHPHCFIEVAEKSVAVGFLDQRQREKLAYVFQELTPGKLFLSRATFREFAGNSEKAELSEVYMFKQDGKVITLRQQKEPGKVQRAENVADVSVNYEGIPAFGEYDAVIRIDR